MTELLHAQVDLDGCVDINYLIAETRNLVAAASDTTAHLLVSMMQLLCRYTTVMEKVRTDRSQLSLVIEETLRLETPVQWLARVAMQDAVVGGVDVPAGATVWLLWGSGNRDPRRFEQPDQFRLNRPNLAKDQLGFGRGPHRCLGAPLARLETMIAFDRLLTRLRNIRVVEEKSDLSNISRDAPSAREQVFEPAGCFHAAKTLVLAFETV
jgi:cytochrome P450